MITKSNFKPAWWLPTAHVQTLYPYVFRNVGAPYFRCERLELPDGDFLDLFWVEGGLSADAPLVILLHGLCGTGDSQYIKAQMNRYQKYGWRSVVMQFRGAGTQPNRKMRAYHSGDTADFNYFLQVLMARESHTKKVAVGFSLGGNVLLKWLGEHGSQNFLSAAVAVSVPFQLNLVADRMNQGFSRIYRNHLLHNLRKQFVRKLADNPNEVFLKVLNSCHCFWTFDEKVTAPLNGFKNVHAYYDEASSRRYLHHIQTPTLIIHALDDPFMSPQAVPSLAELSPHITLELSEKGGHVGFITGTIPGRPIFWLDHRIPEFFNDFLGKESLLCEEEK